MCSPSQILSAREEKNNRIIAAAEGSNVITVKANIPGSNKRVKESNLLIRYFTNCVLHTIGGEAEFFDCADGPYAIIKTANDNLKERTVEIEKTDPIGRFCDIDVYLKGTKRSLSRGYMRLCFICDKPAFVCARQSNHTAEELLSVLKRKTREYLSARIAEVIKMSLLCELNLENKFGLVTPTSCGSHTDLNYEIMLKSQSAIIPYLVQAFWTGLDADGSDGLLNTLRPIGIEAEKAMYEAVKTNAYKGFIFVAGALLSSVGCLISRNELYFNDIFSTAAKICKGITAELKCGGDTGGITAYKKYKITGVRGQAEQGFPAVKQAVELIGGDLSSYNLLKVLCHIVGSIDDTVLLKRSGSFEKYQYFKSKISSVDISDKEQLNSLNDECIKNNISIGGSADILAVSVMLYKLRNLLF